MVKSIHNGTHFMLQVKRFLEYSISRYTFLLCIQDANNFHAPLLMLSPNIPHIQTYTRVLNLTNT